MDRDPGEDPNDGLPGYNESLESNNIDSNPDFRETLRLLNAAGAHTVSSCQGHAPGTQYPEVIEWMEPYVTCFSSTLGNLDLVERLLSRAGEDHNAIVSVHVDGKTVAEFPKGWDWKRSVKSLKEGK